jgi:hypothetical protein
MNITQSECKEVDRFVLGRFLMAVVRSMVKRGVFFGLTRVAARLLASRHNTSEN